MATHRKIGVSIPDELFHYLTTEIKRTGKSKSAIVSDALRAKFEPPAQDLEPADDSIRDELDQLRADLDKLLRLAESTGAPI